MNTRLVPAGLCLLLLALCGIASCQLDQHRVRRFEVNGRTVTVDNTKATFRIEVQDKFEDRPGQAYLARGLYKSYLAAYEAAKAQGARILPSVSLVMNKGKALNDGLYAAIELAVEGPGQWPGGMGQPLPAMGKAQFLDELLQRLDKAQVATDLGEQAARLAVSRLVAALQAGGQWDDKPLPAHYDRNLAADTSRKPVSFYTWTDQLRTIYRRDSALQVGYDGVAPEQVAAAALIAREILRKPADGVWMREPYNRLNALYATLTNPLDGPTAEQVLDAAGGEAGLERAINDKAAATDLGRRLGGEFALFQPCYAKENATVYMSGMDGFVQAVRSGEINLKPTDKSGWYDYQQYALEPLLLPEKTPEGKKLTLDEKYRKLLESAFKSLAAQVRETHALHLRLSKSAAPMPEDIEVGITPYFAVEPWGTSYLRLRDAYQFLRSKLGHLVPGYASLKPLREGGAQGEVRADKALWEMAGLTLGAYFLAARDAGVDAGKEARSIPAGAGPLMQRAEQWLQSWHTDPDMARDVRMMIQVAREPNRYWAVTGVRLTKLKVSFIEKPEVKSEGVTPKFADATYWLPTEQFIEVMGLPEPLDREEFRALCDKAQTTDAIVKALAEKGVEATPPARDGGATMLPGGAGAAAVSVVVLALIGLVVVRIARGAMGR